MRLYDTDVNAQRSLYHHKAAVLDCCFAGDDTRAYSGGLDRSLTMYDFTTGTLTALGDHADAIRCTEYVGDHGVVVTGGWDNCVKVWDPRAATALQHSLSVPNKVYSVGVGAAGSAGGSTFVVACKDQAVLVFDMRSLPAPAQTRTSSLKYQTRCVRMYPDGSGYAVSSIEGRVAMEFLDMSEATQKRKYAFKCHRAKVDGKEHVFPVNALAFHPTFGTFATGGCDGFVTMWDGNNKKRLATLPHLPTSIAALAFNHDGSKLAIAASYTFEEGDREHPADAVYVRTVAASEVTPKAKKAAA